jgi:hypothetical protein
MGKYKSPVTDHLFIGAVVSLTPGQERFDRGLGLAIPDPVAVKLIIDTGSRRSSLVPGIIRYLDPFKVCDARVESSLGTAMTSLHWVRLEFPGSNLNPLAHLTVARLSMPPLLANYHGVIGRDLLLAWESFSLEGRKKRFTIRDTRRGLLDWLRLR